MEDRTTQHSDRFATSADQPSRLRRAFSLIELMVVIGVTLLLTSLLMPALSHVKENAHRVICMAHLQQMGQAFFMYATNFKDRLPYSATLQVDGWPQDLMAARRSGPTGGWDGMGLLFSMDFCPSAECFYCPSHHGSNQFERYADLWDNPSSSDAIFTNYHYAGDVDWLNKNKRRNLDDGALLNLASDGLRSTNDFNHQTGMNILRGDGSVRWRDNTIDILASLPREDQLPDEDYSKLWDKLGGNH